MKPEYKNYKISILGEFIDKNLENEFFNHYMTASLKYIRPIVLALGLLYMMFIIPDYFIIKNPVSFRMILMNRLFFMILIVVLYIAVKKINNYSKLAYWITIYEIIGFLLFINVLFQYENPNFFIQSFGLMVIILGIFLAPNKWINMLAASLTASITFFIASAFYFHEIKFMEYSAGIVYIIIVLILSSAASYKTNFYHRRQYLYSRELLLLSILDPLTCIYNRSKFNEELERWINHSRRYGTPFSVVIIDIDNFKIVNDTYGHLAGDKVIIDTVNIIKDAIRTTDVLARWGGEEFMLLLPETEKSQAVELSERLRILIENHDFEKIHHVTCSFGLVMFKEDYNADMLINIADDYLYKAKKSGKNKVVCL
ncbi:MAG: GGDEF domain-containing protein [Solirubrobacterales bacterium]